MILVLCSIPMGRRHHANTRIRGLKEAAAAVVLIQHGNGSFTYGVGVLHPDADHMHFNESAVSDPRQLWLGMYATSKLSCLSSTAVALAVAIADKSIPIDDPRFTGEECFHCLRYGYSAEMLRTETLAQEPPLDDIKTIVTKFKRWDLPIDDPFAKVVKKEVSPSWEIFPRMTGAEMSPAM